MTGEADVSSAHLMADGRIGRVSRGRVEHDDPLRRRSEDLVRLIKDMKDQPGAGAVHQLRTTIRRIETLLSDDASSGARKLRKQLDRLRRRAGKVRDVDVHLKALRGLPRSLGADARDALRDVLAKARAKREKRLVRALESERDRGVVKRLRAVVTRAAVTRPTGVAAERALAEVLADFEAAYGAAAPLGAANLHAFRIATKRLRYRAEVLASDPEAARAERALKRAQDAIGRWHDWLTLAARAERVFDAGASPILAAVRARLDTELEKALGTVERVARQLAKLRPSGGRKGVRRMTAPDAGAPKQSVGASA